MAREQLQCLPVNATTSFLERQLAAQCLPFLKRKTLRLLLLSQKETTPSWDHVTYFIVLHFAMGVEKHK